MRKIFLLLSILALVFYSNIALTQNFGSWFWVNYGRSYLDVTGKSLAVDDSCNLTVVGHYDGGSFHYNNTSAMVYGDTSRNIVVVSTDSAGSYRWIFGAAGPGRDEVNKVATDVNGNVYITGSFDGDSIAFGTVVLYNSQQGNKTAFIAKLDNQGHIQWAKAFIGNGPNEGSGIDVDLSNNIILTGNFSGSFLLLDVDSIANAGGTDIFIASLNPTGQIQWTKSIGGAGDDRVKDVCMDNSGNGFIAGSFNSTTFSFDNSTLLNNTGTEDIVIASFGPGGQVIWLRGEGGNDIDIANSIAVDSSGACYIAGAFRSGALAIDTTNLINNGGYDFLLVKYDNTGFPLWAKSGGVPDDDVLTGLDVTPNGTIGVTGWFDSNWLVWDVMFFYNASNPNPLMDAFGGYFDTNGNNLWMAFSAGDNDDMANDLVVDNTGSGYVTGHTFSNDMWFYGAGIIGNGGPSDLFFAKLGKADDGTGLSETNTISPLFVAPSPATWSTVIESDQLVLDGTIIFMDVTGRIVKRWNHISGNRTEIDVSDICGGLYFIQLLEGASVLGESKIVIGH